MSELTPAEMERIRLLADQADDRAHRIASIAAEELVRCEGQSTDTDCYRIPMCQADEHFRDCLKHLEWSGQAVSFETDDGYIHVTLGDFTLSSLGSDRHG